MTNRYFFSDLSGLDLSWKLTTGEDDPANRAFATDFTLPPFEREIDYRALRKTGIGAGRRVLADVKF